MLTSSSVQSVRAGVLRDYVGRELQNGTARHERAVVHVTIESV